MAPESQLKKALLWTSMTILLLAALVIAFLIQSGGLELTFFEPQSIRLYKNCMDQMGRGDCLIMHNTAYLPPEVKQVFISGYGELDADTYRNLRKAEIRMCPMIRAACDADAQSEVCRLGKALYSQR